MVDHRARESRNLSPIWRRCLLEGSLRSKATRLDAVVVVLFLIAVALLLVAFLPDLFGPPH
jgi:hypothetical protein